MKEVEEQLAAMRERTRLSVGEAKSRSAANLVKCPAGQAQGERGIYCGIEETLIEATVDPSSICNFCTRGYTGCPTWRASKNENGITASTYVDQVRRQKAKQLDEENEFFERHGMTSRGH